MSNTVNMLANAGAANQNYSCKSGASYTSDAYGVIANVSSQDVNDMESMGCLPFGAAATGKNNFTATTNPGVTNDITEGYAVGSQWFNKNTGVLYQATAITDGAAAWANINAASVAGLSMVTGRFYSPIDGSTQAAVLTVTGNLYAVPIFIPNAITLDKLHCSVTTGQVGGKARYALFYDNAGYPGAIVPGTDSGDLDATGTAVVASPALAKALPAGWYWLASIFTASVTFPSVIGATAIYADSLNSLIGSDSAAHALATAGQATTGIVKGSQTYPVVDMATSFPTFPSAAALVINATTPVAALGV